MTDQELVDSFIVDLKNAMSQIQQTENKISFVKNGKEYEYVVKGVPAGSCAEADVSVDFVELHYVYPQGNAHNERFVVLDFEYCSSVWKTNIRNLYYEGESNIPSKKIIYVDVSDKSELEAAMIKAASNTESSYLLKIVHAISGI